MKQLVVSSFVFGAVAIAAAQPAPPVPAPIASLTPPPGWLDDADGAARVVDSLGAAPPFTGAGLSIDAQVWKAPTGGAALVATQVVTETPITDPDRAASLALHGLRAGADAIVGAKVVRFDLAIDPAGKLHQASLEWSDPSVGTTTVARAMVFRRGPALMQITGECVWTAEAAAARPACEAVLATLRPSSEPLDPLTVSAQPPSAAPPDAPPRPTGAAVEPPPRLSPRDTEIPATLAITKPKARTDTRPYYVLGGLLILAAVFWWNRQQRARLAAAEQAEERRRTRRADGEPAADDRADGDDATDDRDRAEPAAAEDAKDQPKQEPS